MCFISKNKLHFVSLLLSHSLQFCYKEFTLQNVVKPLLSIFLFVLVRMIVIEFIVILCICHVVFNVKNKDASLCKNAKNRKDLRMLTLQLIWIATLVAMDMADLLVMLRETTTCVGTARSTVHFFFTASYLKTYGVIICTN